TDGAVEVQVQVALGGDGASGGGHHRGYADLPDALGAEAGGDGLGNGQLAPAAPALALVPDLEAYDAALGEVVVAEVEANEGGGVFADAGLASPAELVVADDADVDVGVFVVLPVEE